jgi:hypothetical protein
MNWNGIAGLLGTRWSSRGIVNWHIGHGCNSSNGRRIGADPWACGYCAIGRRRGLHSQRLLNPEQTSRTVHARTLPRRLPCPRRPFSRSVENWPVTRWHSRQRHRAARKGSSPVHVLTPPEMTEETERMDVDYSRHPRVTGRMLGTGTRGSCANRALTRTRRSRP